MRKYSGRRSSAGDNKGEAGFWPSYADMMSAVALILFFLMLLAYIQNLITGNDLRRTKEELDDTSNALLLTLEKVTDAESELELISIDLDTAKQELLKQQACILEQREAIEKLRLQAENQADYLAATQGEITELRGQMQTIAVLRLSILEQMKNSIERVMDNGGTVSIGENGSIILSESVLFDLGSSLVKPESYDMLNQLSRVFVSFLGDTENSRYVDSIVISGHTDNIGSTETNRALSTERANSVLSYLMLANDGDLGRYAKYFCAAGYGSTRPVQTNDTAEGRAANRRIEISIILKDESVLEIVEQYLAIEMPDQMTDEVAEEQTTQP